LKMDEIINFGKYKGQPVSVLASDPGYCDYMCAQPWFREKYNNLYTIIINNFKIPEDTPEHNKLQALFLDKDFVVAVAKKIYTPEFMIGRLEDGITKYKYKWDNGWKVIETPDGEKTISQIVNTISSIRKNPDEFCTSVLSSAIREVAFEEKGWDVVIGIEYYSLFDIELTNRSIFIEIKPQIGDDFPSVLRQMKARRERNKIYGIGNLMYKEYHGEGISEDLMRKYFGNEGFTCLRFDEV